MMMIVHLTVKDRTIMRNQTINVKELIFHTKLPSDINKKGAIASLPFLLLIITIDSKKTALEFAHTIPLRLLQVTFAHGGQTVN
jgi:hypothetical protein